MAEREVLWGWDLDEAPADPGAQNHHGEPDRTGHDPATEPIPVVDAHQEAPGADPQTHEPETARPEPFERETSYARPFIERPAGSPVGTLTFRPPPPPWYRTKPGVITLIAIAALVLLAAILPLVLRSPSGGEEPSGVTPSPSAEPTTAAPSPSGAQPSMSRVPAPPPPPPPPLPPPPPPPVQDSAPAYTPYYPAPRNSSPSDKPEIGVTRAPISVAPEVQAPRPGEAKVGEGKPNRGFW